MQQALEYSDMLNIPFVFSSNGDGFIFHDKTAKSKIEIELNLENFPSPAELWTKYLIWKGIKTEEQKSIVEQDYYFDDSGKTPRYYQLNAINATIEAIANGQNRILLVMATGQEKLLQHFKLFGDCGKPKLKKGYSI